MSNNNLTSPPPLRSALRQSRPCSPVGSPLPTGNSTSGFNIGLLDPSASSTQTNLLRPSPRTPASASFSPNVGYTPKVSFDTFKNPNDDALFSYTLQVKSDGYRRSRRTRIFLCAASPDVSGQKALEWCIEELVSDDDELVVVRGFDAQELEKDHDELRRDADALMRQIQEINSESHNSKLSIVVEFVAGRITDTIERMIALYRPDSLIVGTRGPRGFLESVGAALYGIGSVSKYCMSHSPVPVIVVQPNRRQTKEKRQADTKRKPNQFGDISMAKPTQSLPHPQPHHSATRP